jgi:hypothetical protein
MKRSLLALLICWEIHRFDAFVTLRPSRSISSLSAKSSSLGATFNGNSADRLPSNDEHKTRPRRQQNPQENKYYNTASNSRILHRQEQERRIWLETATDNLLDTTPGSLENGKWHELVSLLNAWRKHVKYDSGAPLIMESIMKRLLDERRAGNTEAKASIAIYNILLDGWACSALFRTDGRNAAQRAREILVLLQETFELEQDLVLKPNVESFDIVFHVVCKVEGAKIARRVLAWMEHLYKTKKNINAKPTYKQYIMLLDAYANSRDENAGQLAEGFLRHMKVTGVTPGTLCYNIAIKAWMYSKRGRESAEHADRILDEMQAPKDIVTYATVISAWAISGMRSHAVSRAEELLRAIEETPGLEPNTVVLNTVMSAWVRSKNPAAINRTQELLEHMEASTQTPPDLISYNTHLHALSSHADKRPGSAERAHDLLLNLEKRYAAREIPFAPNLFTYNIVIEAWSKSRHPNAAWKAVEVLRKLISQNNGRGPDTFSYNQALSALSRSNKPGAALLAEELLNCMEEAYKLRVHRNAIPDVTGYTSAIVAWSRSNEADAAERAERILSRMKERYAAGEHYLKPNRMIFNSLIDCWAKSGKGTLGARKAEALLQEMQVLCALGDVSVAPNSVTYNSVLNSWARSGTRCCGNKAESYLNRMWELYSSGDQGVRPTDKTFNTVRTACVQICVVNEILFNPSYVFFLFVPNSGHQRYFKKSKWSQSSKSS